MISELILHRGLLQKQINRLFTVAAAPSLCNDTSVFKNFDEKGFESSGGEGQKLALARALYKDAPIVLLDEPTAAMDPKAEYELYQRFNEMVQGKTAVYISHRLSSAKFCDIIAVFHNGQIIEYGTHDELYSKGGSYTALFSMQSRFYC